MSDIAVLNTTSALSAKSLDTLEGDQTITGLKTYDRDPSAPFAVTASSAVVTNLDADKLDGQEGTYYTNMGNAAAGTLAVARGGTNSATALNSNRAIVSSAGALVEAAAATNGQLLIGSTSAAPVVAAITAGTGITVTNGAGTITLAATASGVKAYTPTLTSVTTTGETDVISWTVGANEMADGDVLFVDFAVQLRNSTGGPITPTVKFKWGATSATLTSGGWSNVAATRVHLIHFRVQRIGNDLAILDPNTGLIGALLSLNYDLTAAGAISTQTMTTPTFTSSQTVKITVTLASYNATNNFWNQLAARVLKVASS